MDIRYNPLKRTYDFRTDGGAMSTNPMTEIAIRKCVTDGDVDDAITLSKVYPDKWVQIMAHKPRTLRAYR